MSTVGFELEQIHAYIRRQDDEDLAKGGQILGFPFPADGS